MLLCNTILPYNSPDFFLTSYRVFSLTWPASMQIYWNKRKRLHKKRVQLPQDPFGTPTWPPFHCFGTPIWPPWRHVKTLYTAFCKLKLPSLHATETRFSSAPNHDYSWGLQLAFQTESRENQPHKNILSTLMEHKTWPTWYNWLHFTHFWLNWRVPKKKTM